MRAVLIINPVSGDDEPKEEKVSTIQKWLTSAPFVTEVCYITKERGAGVIARAAGVEVVLVAGGDGTVSEVARELVHKPGTLGILPIGLPVVMEPRTPYDFLCQCSGDLLLLSLGSDQKCGLCAGLYRGRSYRTR